MFAWKDHGVGGGPVESRTIERRSPAVQRDGFRHDALFYRGPSDFVARTASFIRDAQEAAEPILVVVSAEKIERLREHLDGRDERVRFADMAAVGANPARIIPAWRAFAEEQAGTGRRFRGIGEPIWSERSAEELVECERHESLLNLAFDEPTSWWLACPYDTQTLPPAVLEEAKRNHPFVVDGGDRRASPTYRGLADVVMPDDRALPDPPGDPVALRFGKADPGLSSVRKSVARAATEFELDPARTDDLVFAAHEIASNSLRHGGGEGVLRIWSHEATLICEVRDSGRIEDPMIGRRHPSTHAESGFGLWLANQLCDLVQIRSLDSGTVVRLHVRG